MKKAFSFIFVFLLLSSCDSIMNSSFSKEVNAIKETKELTISESINFDGKIISKKNGYYDITNAFKAYSYVINNDSKFYNSTPNSSTVENFCLANKGLIKIGNNEYNYNVASSSILEYKGINELFDNYLSSKKAENKIHITSIYNVIRDAYYDLGYIIDYQSIVQEIDINYKLSLENNSLTLNFDLTNVYKKILPQIKNAVKTYTFKLGYNKDFFVNYPSTSSPSISDEKKEQELKQGASSYIKNVYSKLKYISNDLSFIYRYPQSGKITFEFLSSNTNILSNTGVYKAPSSDVDIELTCILKYEGVEYERQVFKAIACPSITRSGVLGSKENPIYKGRTPIDDVEIYFIEMHRQYGDSIYIKAGDFDMLIDAGQSEDGGYVSRFVSEQCVDSCLDMVVATHAHSDHIGGMNSVLNTIKKVTYSLDYGYQKENYNLSSTVRNNMKNKSDYYSAVTDALKVNNGVIYISDDFYITLLDTGQYLTPSQDIKDGDDNDASVTFIMTYKNHSYYFSGDLGNSGESYLASTNQLKKVDLMKASHHGSSTSNSTNLLNKIKPSVVCVSTALVERGNASTISANQIHPNQNALNRFYSAGAKVYCNFTMGTIHVNSKGNGSLSVEGLGVTSPYYINGKAITGEENMEFKNTAWANKYRR